MREVDARENAYHLMLAIDLLENRLKGLDDAANVAKERIATKRAKKKPVGSTTF